MATPFVEERLPDEVERGAVGGPMFKTVITPLESGHEQRNIQWSQSRGEWDIGYGLAHLDETGGGHSGFYLNQVIDFFYARRGRAVGFRFKDWTDYQISNQIIGVGNAVLTDFQVVKIYNEVGVSYTREITKLVDATLSVTVDGLLTVDYTVDINTGLITFNSPPADGAVIAVTCEFDVPVRFDTDKLDITAFTALAGTIGSLTIVEVRQ